MSLVRSKLLSEFLDIEEQILPMQFLEEISHFSRKIISISGGIDSAAAAIALWKEGIKCELFWGDIRRSMPESRATICELIKITGWEFHIAYPDVDMRMLRQKTEKQIDDVLSGRKRYMKHSLSCCYYLKEKPLKIWLRRNSDENTVIISSIAGYEAMQRQLRLGQLRTQGTYLRFKKMEQCWFAYPWRDMTNRKDGDRLIAYVHQIIPNARHSGCIVCPVLVIVEDKLLTKMEPGQDRIDRSKRVFLKKTGNDA